MWGGGTWRERVIECVGVEEGEGPLLPWSARASNFCERDDILYHQATSRTKALQDSRKKQDDTRSVEDRVDSTCICKMFCW